MNSSFIIVALVLCVLSTESIRVTVTRCEEADREYCLNGSTCLRKTLEGNSKHVIWCKCPQWFYGPRCEHNSNHLEYLEEEKPSPLPRPQHSPRPGHRHRHRLRRPTPNVTKP